VRPRFVARTVSFRESRKLSQRIPIRHSAPSETHSSESRGELEEARATLHRRHRQLCFRGFGKLCGSWSALTEARVPAWRSRRAIRAASNRAAAATFSPPQAEMCACSRPRGASSRRTNALTRTRRLQRPSARDGGHCAGRTGARGAPRAVISAIERDDGRRRPDPLRAQTRLSARAARTSSPCIPRESARRSRASAMRCKCVVWIE
jgi:hypothetical protein